MTNQQEAINRAIGVLMALRFSTEFTAPAPEDLERSIDGLHTLSTTLLARAKDEAAVHPSESRFIYWCIRREFNEGRIHNLEVYDFTNGNLEVTYEVLTPTGRWRRLRVVARVELEETR